MNTSEFVSRDKAAIEIADHIRGRLSYVIVIPPQVFSAAVQRLAMLPYGTLYADGGMGDILKTPTSNVAAIATVVADVIEMPLTGVALVPKAVRKKMLTRALGQPLPAEESQDIAEESQDIVMLRGPGDGYAWPVVFVLALDHVDPAAAAAIRKDAR